MDQLSNTGTWALVVMLLHFILWVDISETLYSLYLIGAGQLDITGQNISCVGLSSFPIYPSQSHTSLPSWLPNKNYLHTTLF